MDETGDQSAPAEVDNSDAAPEQGNAELDALFDGPGDEDDSSNPEPDDDEEIEYEGKKFRAPKDLKLNEAILRQADYTKKTQEVAEQRRQTEETQTRLQQEQRAFQETVQRQQANIQAYVNVAAMDQQLQQYEQANWQALNAQDPTEAQRLWFQYQQLKDNRGRLVNQIAQHEQQMAIQAQQQTARTLEEARGKLQAVIKDWSPTRVAELQEYGKKEGYSSQELASITDHRAVIILDKARKYDQMMAQAAKKPAAAAPAAPLRVVKSGSGNATNPNDMTMDQWAVYEQKRLAKKRS